MNWLIVKPKLEATFNAAGWKVVHNQNAGMLVVTTLQGDIYFFGEDKNPNNPCGFAFVSLLESIPRYTLDPIEVFLAWFIKNN